METNLLKVGKNEVKMSILNKYRNDGCGLHSFVDAVDSQQYLYSQFESDFAHYVFPNFDQPDLKATWTLNAVVPSDWIVISNEYTNADRKE